MGRRITEVLFRAREDAAILAVNVGVWKPFGDRLVHSVQTPSWSRQRLRAVLRVPCPDMLWHTLARSGVQTGLTTGGGLSHDFLVIDHQTGLVLSDHGRQEPELTVAHQPEVAGLMLDFFDGLWFAAGPPGRPGEPGHRPQVADQVAGGELTGGSC